MRLHPYCLQRQAFYSSAQIAKHTLDYAELILEAGIFPQVVIAIRDKDTNLRKEAANLIKELCKHSYETSQIVVNSGAVTALVDYLEETKGSAAKPGIMALGYIAAHSDTQAITIIKSHVRFSILSKKLISGSDSTEK